MLEKLLELAVQTTPFAVVGLLVAIGWLVRQRREDRNTYEASKKGYKARIVTLEAQRDELQEKRLADYQQITELVHASAQANVAAAAAMEGRNRTTGELFEVVKELVTLVKVAMAQGGFRGAG